MYLALWCVYSWQIKAQTPYYPGNFDHFFLNCVPYKTDIRATLADWQRTGWWIIGVGATEIGVVGVNTCTTSCTQGIGFIRKLGN